MVNDAIHNTLSTLQKELERLKKATDYIELSKNAGDKTIDAIAKLQENYSDGLTEMIEHYKKLGDNLTLLNQTYQSEIIQKIQASIDSSIAMMESSNALKLANDQLISRLDNPTFVQVFDAMRTSFSALETENHQLIAHIKGQEKELYETFLKYQQKIHQIYLKNTQEYFDVILGKHKAIQDDIVKNLHNFEENLSVIEQSIENLEQLSISNQKILFAVILLAVINIGSIMYLLVR